MNIEQISNVRLYQIERPAKELYSPGETELMIPLPFATFELITTTAFTIDN
jgi:hypothetical protein